MDLLGQCKEHRVHLIKMVGFVGVCVGTSVGLKLGIDSRRNLDRFGSDEHLRRGLVRKSERCRVLRCLEDGGNGEDGSDLIEVKKEKASSEGKVKKGSQKHLFNLKSQLVDAVEGKLMGFVFGEESDDQEEDLIEDIIEKLEDESMFKNPTGSQLLVNNWRLIYTSSSIARFNEGLSSLHKFIPGGRCVGIRLNLGARDSDAELVESLVGAGGFETDITVSTKWRIRDESCFVLEHDKIQWFMFKRYADSWKPLRAFTVFDITYLDQDILITRGQTGQVYCWQVV
mmetsp:Transcript_3153/g.5543  ORF Transcript_3153/g.5543 Transcript_3153/m.5543 type:complete len:285 (-) Transcript_3153:2080-2934(-)